MTTQSPRAPRALVLFTIASFGCVPFGCEAEGGHDPALAFYDHPHSFPAGSPYVGEQTEIETKPAEPSDECGRGRGIDPEGACVVLNTRKLPYGGMVQIPAGAFLRGDIPVRYDADANREFPYIHWSGQPLREDALPSFWIDGFEISRRAYAECVAAGECGEAKCLDGSDGRPDREIGRQDLENFPQTCVTHSQAADYCEWRGARLPSEAEWEFAARGPEAWAFPWGNELRDEIGQTIGPVGYDPLDISYWGLKGFGGNSMEWVADEFDPEANLKVYLRGEFRAADGPLARAEQTYLRTLVCGPERAADPTCVIGELGKRHVIKGGRAGQRGGAYDFPAGVTLASTLPKESFERTRALAQHSLVGFRCAQDLAGEDTILSSPKPAVRLPLLRQDGNYELFLGVAEAVDRREAEAFCKALRVPGDPEQGETGWRLPSLAEIRATYLWFAGPGPFWTSEGAAEQTFVDTQTAEWEAVEPAADPALLVRCIRTR
ncbi:formylglycine-generating enzyme family protein [Nannocystaceae bacterium ST9]